jgi:hypothetical protein
MAAIVFAVCIGSLAANAEDEPSHSFAAKEGWGTYYKPFSATSLWNSRPVAPVLGDFLIPTSNYHPLIGEGKYSLQVFLADAADKPAKVHGLPGSKGIWDPDAEVFSESVEIPHWPAEVVPAEGNDGHADIVDAVSGLVHSFHKLQFLNGKWVASQYAWTRIDGRGWGDPAHYFQGARAAAVPSMGGLIRKHEVNDGRSLYQHALAVSLTFNALAAQPSFIFPATSGDGNAAKTNYGKIPEGALLMLPRSFDAESISNPMLRKVVETLKVYGAYVVDRNYGTPFYIYVEIGSGFNLHSGGWNNVAAADLDRIRLALRQVVSTDGWVDGYGRPFIPAKNLNLLSMRGPWSVRSGSTPGGYDSWAQAVVFPRSTERTVQVNSSSRVLNPVVWAKPAPGALYQLTARATGGAQLRLEIIDKSDRSKVFDSGELADGQHAQFNWPSPRAVAFVYAISGVGGPSSVRGELIGVGR